MELDLSKPCVDWPGNVDKYGYGRLAQKRFGTRRAHRFSYIQAKGPIPSSLTIDHVCRNRKCINPAHLEAVTLVENVMRGMAPSAQNARKTHCIRGHEFTDENTCYERFKDGSVNRHCRPCKRIIKNAWRKRTGKH